MSGNNTLDDDHPTFDTGIPHIARVYNYWLGGKDNYAADRELAEKFIQADPKAVDGVRSNRAFLGRAVEFLVTQAGLRQFLDLGTGIPTADNTHEVAQRHAPASRIVYVDNDPIVLAHARALLTSSLPAVTSYVDANVHDPATILEAAARTLDFSEPVGIMMLGIMNFVLDNAEAAAIVQHVLGGVASGSYLAMSHPTTELGGEANAEAMRFWNEHAKPPIRARTGAEVRQLLAGVELVEPGLVSCALWRPDTADARRVPHYGAVGRKR